MSSLAQANPAGELWAVIPVKPLLESKKRLAHLLPAEQRANLVRELMCHVLAAVQQVPEITRTAVISSDPVVWAVGEALGAAIIQEEPPPDLNTAVARAYAIAVHHDAAGVLILPVDLPYVTAEDISLLIETGLGRPSDEIRGIMAAAPDKAGEGTNALFLYPPLEFTFRFGPGSLQRHIHEALERKIAVRLVYAPGLQFDLDTAEDLLVFQGAAV
jgi:2-phospho-L-lactate guanylyltransferase